MSPITLPGRIVGVLRQEPGLSDRELTDRLFGPGSSQTAVNRECLRLAEAGLVARRRRPDGLIGNYLTETPPADGAAGGHPA